ncbi:PhnD/SsuA/transferrin family substrate-binding protein [Candidatus Viridilinea mediisalina]|uniref:Phosphonate ABC transporter substrate-binding protein n=1 Tax=Candidatus Viridilinea mediisalina TaxID=2024553 RepID=A0A2A6RPX4_9CHLR|nr:PhnD/SsuA/transferrin family substrate-binding protein [Candidatus Viridilinea mediisalina]PDW04951.1 phosphonate ABC transporter substrate-binding protein [Candidatus Viridilinea mediisalina]
MRSLLALLLISVAMILSACGGTPAPSAAPAPSGATPAPASAPTTPLIMAWYPNESGSDLKDARDALAEVISETLNRPVEHQTTTDYIIAIEAMVNNNAHLAFFGAEGYIQANERNAAVVPLVIPSGSDGTAETAVYYSWLAVMRGQEENYQENGVYGIDNIQGKRFSFVSNNSTSGFRVPSSNIVRYFGAMEQWQGLTADDLIEGGSNSFFADVQFGGSHQGTLVNLITDRVDVASFCDTCVANYVELVAGSENAVGAVYRVIENADEPFDKYPGAEFVLIESVPVLNAPFVANGAMLSAEEIQALQEVLTSDAVAENPRIFATKEAMDAGFRPLLRKTGEDRFVVVPDSFFDPIRAMR